MWFDASILDHCNTLWAATMAETLFRVGLERVVISPGSSSSALALGFYKHPKLRSTVILDERSAAFFALGMAKSTTKPVALICTSGTAAANYYPALIEARLSGTPLLVLTADRPPDDRHCQSEQTIDQQRLYSHTPVWQRELPLPRSEVKLFETLRDQLAYAYERALFPEPGPVHLNVPFIYHPLTPKADPALKAIVDALTPVFFEKIHSYSHSQQTLSDDSLAATCKELLGYKRGIITVGAARGIDHKDWVEVVACLSKSFGWPVLADALAPGVRGAMDKIPTLVSSYDAIVRNNALMASLQPDAVLHLGRLPTHKGLREWLKSISAHAYHLDPTPEHNDPLFRGARMLRLSPALFAHAFSEARKPTPYAQQWLSLGEKVQQKLDMFFSQETQLFESKVPWHATRHLPAGTPWFISTSMPIRECEAFMPIGNHRYKTYCNRGANGLDGLLATALGVAEGEQKPTFLLIGDLGLLHDSGSLLLGKNGFQGSLTILCVDNEGGAIFRHIPALSNLSEDLLKNLWLTPQVADIPVLAEAYGCDFHEAFSWEGLASLLEKPPVSGIRFIYLKTDAQADFKKRAGLLHAVQNSLSI